MLLLDAPAAFFARLRRWTAVMKYPLAQANKPRPHELIVFLRVVWYMIVTRSDLRSEFLRTFINCLRQNPRTIGHMNHRGQRGHKRS